MLASAPALLSTTTGLAHRFERPSAYRRAAASLALPAGNGTINRTVRVGQGSAAWLADGARPATASRPTAKTERSPGVRRMTALSCLERLSFCRSRAVHAFGRRFKPASIRRRIASERVVPTLAA